jgi:hypothetical protein
MDGVKLMIDDEGPQTVLIPARRILVVDDLGTVRRGDHVLMVGNVIISIDTSRDTSTVMPTPKALSAPKRRKRRANINEITQQTVLDIIREHEPISSMEISDSLNLERKDPSGRGKVTRMIHSLMITQQIRQADGRGKLFRYETIKSEA